MREADISRRISNNMRDAVDYMGRYLPGSRANRSELEEERVRVRNRYNELSLKLGILKSLEENGIDYKKGQELMPDFIQYLEDHGYGSSFKVILEEKIAAFVKNVDNCRIPVEWSSSYSYNIYFKLICFRDGKIEKEEYNLEGEYKNPIPKPEGFSREYMYMAKIAPYIDIKVKEITNVTDKGFDVILENEIIKLNKIKHCDLKKIYSLEEILKKKKTWTSEELIKMKAKGLIK